MDKTFIHEGTPAAFLGVRFSSVARGLGRWRRGAESNLNFCFIKTHVQREIEIHQSKNRGVLSEFYPRQTELSDRPENSDEQWVSSRAIGATESEPNPPELISSLLRPRRQPHHSEHNGVSPAQIRSSSPSLRCHACVKAHRITTKHMSPS